VELWYFKEHWEHRPRVTLYGTRNLSSDHAAKSGKVGLPDISNNVGPVKSFLSALLHSLREWSCSFSAICASTTRMRRWDRRCPSSFFFSVLGRIGRNTYSVFFSTVAA
jgi:hypothetical protein